MPTNNFTSFTITQAFLGAPLQFVPALGSQELEQLVDAYVPSTASKQEKLSEVTIDFYNHATVDLNTGALVKRYDVFLASPLSQSSISPSMYTPSPPAARHRNTNRVSKKSATTKTTKKDAEPRLPGFSIMTKDGVDVTNSASRGTKTKEQREHAHLMRIMKACDDCKRKKVRCDPSHRRQSNDMSRTNSSSSRKPSSASSSRANPSPTASTPSLSQHSSFASQATTPSFTPTSAIDDFVLFPEDSWNPADLSIPEDAELSQFFDINDINLDISMNSADFNFSAFDDMQPFDFNDLSFQSFAPQQHPAGLPLSQPRHQTSSSPQGSALLDLNLQDSWASGLLDAVSHSRPHPSSSTQDNSQSSSVSVSPATTNVSTHTPGTSGEEIWPDGFGRSPSGRSGSFDSSQRFLPQSSPSYSVDSPVLLTSHSDTFSTLGVSSPQFFNSIQQHFSEHPSTASRHDLLEQQSPSSSAFSDDTQQSPEATSGYASMTSSRTSLQTDDSQYCTESTRTKRRRESAVSPLARQQVSRSSSSSSGDLGHELIPWPNTQVESGSTVQVSSISSRGSGTTQPLQAQATGNVLGLSNVFAIANACTLVSESLRNIKQGPASCLSLAGDLQRLRTHLVQYHSELQKSGSASSAQASQAARLTASQINAFGEQLQGLSVLIRRAQVQETSLPPPVLRQCQIQARLLLRSLCATINSLESTRSGITASASPAGGSPRILTAGRNLQLFVPSLEAHDRDRHAHSLDTTSLGSIYDGDLIAEDGRFAPPRSHALRIAEEERRYAFAFHKATQEHLLTTAVSTAAVATEAAPFPNIIVKPILVTENTDSQLLEFWNRQTDMVREVESEQQRVAGEQQSRPDYLSQPPSALTTDLALASSLRTQVGTYEQDTVSRDSISRTPLVLSFTLVAIAVLTFASVITITKSSPTSPVLGHIVEALRNLCQQQTPHTSLASLARLVLFAAVVANPPSYITVIGAMATISSMFSAGMQNNSCGADLETTPAHTRTRAASLSQANLMTRERRPHWLGMMNRLTTAVAS